MDALCIHAVFYPLFSPTIKQTWSLWSYTVDHGELLKSEKPDNVWTIHRDVQYIDWSSTNIIFVIGLFIV